MRIWHILYHQSNVAVLGAERWYLIVHSVGCSNYCTSRQKFYKGKTYCKVQLAAEVIAYLHSHCQKSSQPPNQQPI